MTPVLLSSLSGPRAGGAVLQRVALHTAATLVAAQGSVLCMFGDGDKFRVLMVDNEDIVKLFDTVKSLR